MIKDWSRSLPSLPFPWLVLSALAAIPVSLIYHGWLTLPALGLNYEIPRDFLCFWVGAKAVLAGHGDRVFSPWGFIALKKVLAGGAFPRLYWLYPPHFLMFVTPIGVFGYVTGFIVWTFLSLGLWLVALRTILPGRPTAWIWATLSPAVLWAIPYGQNGIIFGACALLAYHYSDHRPWIAGLFAALLTMKPQVAPIIAVIFLAQGNWRAILSGILGTTALAGASIALLGTAAWRDYIKVMGHQGAKITYTRTDVLHQQATLLAGLRQIGLGLDLAITIHLAAAAVAMATAFVVIRRTRASTRWLPAIIFLNMLISPYTLAYDMIPLSIAVITLTPTTWTSSPGWPRQGLGGQGWSLQGWVVPSLCWILPILVVPLNSIGVPPGPPLILAGTAFALWQLRSSNGHHCNQAVPAYAK